MAKPTLIGETRRIHITIDGDEADVGDTLARHMIDLINDLTGAYNRRDVLDCLIVGLNDREGSVIN